MTDTEAGVWFRRFHGGSPGTVRLVCLPHAGGSAPFFRPLSAALPPEIETYCVQYPGRQDRHLEEPLHDLGELADRIADVLAPWAGEPLALFGHSMGATIAYEVARRLDGPVTRLFCSGRSAPSVPRAERVHLRSDDGLLAEVRELSGTDLRVLADAEMVRLVLPALRADYRAIETYRWAGGPGLTCPVTAMAGAEDPRVKVDDVALWGEHTSGDFELRVFDGGHFFLSEDWAAVAALVAARLVPRSTG
ncbi:thioesterase II family protein [Nonomuraea antri]|uniref:thioesterase II family protein n=1 Tax=Nonomuraea antri TaxID=2730852 RepID=UPI001C2C7BD1|nr:alpha/beta fold hydrolase [Nonomuraea antri]